MAQQALRIAGAIGAQGQSRKSTQRGDMARVLAQDLPEELLGLAPLIGDQRRNGDLDPRKLGIRESCALEGDPRLRVLVEIDEYITIGEPRAVMSRQRLQHQPHLIARLIETARPTKRARQVDTGIRKISSGGECTLECLDARRDPVLIEKRDPEEPRAVDLAGKPPRERPQAFLRAAGPALAQQRQSMTKALGEFSL